MSNYRDANEYYDKCFYCKCKTCKRTLDECAYIHEFCDGGISGSIENCKKDIEKIREYIEKIGEVE